MRVIVLVVVAALVTIVGCSQQDETSTPPVDGSKYLLVDEPTGAKEVIQVREEAKDGDAVVLVGRIGGRSKPWIKDTAAFSIVDQSLKPCIEDGCKKPWDYCCESSDKLASSTAFIKVVDEEGATVKADAQQLLDVKELSTIIVKGKAKRDDEGNLTVLANAIFVKSK